MISDRGDPPRLRGRSPRVCEVPASGSPGGRRSDGVAARSDPLAQPGARAARVGGGRGGRRGSRFVEPCAVLGHVLLCATASPRILEIARCSSARGARARSRRGTDRACGCPGSSTGVRPGVGGGRRRTFTCDCPVRKDGLAQSGHRHCGMDGAGRRFSPGAPIRALTRSALSSGARPPVSPGSIRPIGRAGAASRPCPWVSGSAAAAWPPTAATSRSHEKGSSFA